MVLPERQRVQKLLPFAPVLGEKVQTSKSMKVLVAEYATQFCGFFRDWLFAVPPSGNPFAPTTAVHVPITVQHIKAFVDKTFLRSEGEDIFPAYWATNPPRDAPMGPSEKQVVKAVGISADSFAPEALRVFRLVLDLWVRSLLEEAKGAAIRRRRQAGKYDPNVTLTLQDNDLIRAILDKDGRAMHKMLHVTLVSIRGDPSLKKEAQLKKKRFDEAQARHPEREMPQVIWAGTGRG